MKALKLIVFIITAVFASVHQEVSDADNKLVAEAEHHRRPLRHRHRRCHSSSSSSSSKTPCCQQRCECPWKEGKSRVRVLTQRYLELMFARQFGTASALELPTMSNPTVAPRCPSGYCCVSSNTEAFLAYFIYAVSFKQMDKSHEIKEHGRPGIGQTYEVTVPVNFYLDPFSELSMNIHLTWVWQADCNLKISAASLSDIRCLSQGGCHLKHYWYPSGPIIPTCTTECVDFAQILRVTSTIPASVTVTTPIPTTVTTTTSTTSTTVLTDSTITTTTAITTTSTTTTTTTTAITTTTTNVAGK